MQSSRLKTLLIGLSAGVTYAFLTMLLVTKFHENVSVSYIFILPLIMGAIPVFFSTKEQLQSYRTYLLMPWGITLTFFILCYAFHFEGMICLIIIVTPFLLLGSLGAFIARMAKLQDNENQTPLYSSLILPFLFLIFEKNLITENQFYTVKTAIEIDANSETVWQNIKNVKDIKSNEIPLHFVHLIGIPKPLNGELDKEKVGGIRQITWEKGIKFQEIITSWESLKGFSYKIKVDPQSIPPTTLDEHVMIGGRYFDVVKGSYLIEKIAKNKQLITLNCTYRITTNLNFYGKFWADFILNDFNEMILEVIKKRCEKESI